MHKILRSAVLCLVAMPLFAQAYDKIGISFSRTGTNAASVTATIVDQKGVPLEGASVSLASSHNFKATSGGVTADMLCFDVNGNSSPTITLTLNITGLKEAISFSEVGLDIHALNGSSNYQANDDQKARQWNVALSQNDQVFGSLSNIDIAANVGTSGSVHKFWSVSGSQATAEGTLKLTLTITKGAENNGCFFGLTDITIGGNDKITPNAGPGPEPEPSAFGGEDKYYHIVWYTNAGSYMTEAGGGVLQVEGKSRLSKQYWQFLPTSKENCYHIKNAVTGHYIEACKTSQNNTYYIKATDTPVEYYISQESAREGAYRLTSTNCSNYNDTSKSPVGLNKDGASSYIITWAAGTNNTGSYWYINPTEFDYDYEAAANRYKHSDFAKASQVYFMPCGSVNSSLAAKSLTVTGEGALKPLDYPCTTWGGSSQTAGTANTSSWWTLYTTDKGQVAQGKEITVNVTLGGTPAAGYLAQACFDWDHDGVFEDVQSIEEPKAKALTFKTTVPAEAVLGESRLRFRLTDNGLTGADEEISGGQILDCMLETIAPAEGQVTVSVNDPNRGTAYYSGTDAIAAPCGNARFLCWLEGRKVVSTSASYAIEATRPVHLVAVFSANTTDERPTGIHAPINSDDTPYATPLYFDLSGRQVSTPAKGQTYIRKDSPRKGILITL